MIRFLGFGWVVATFIGFATSATAQEVDCPADPHWSDTNPSINIEHVFCGEVDRGRAKGFHSRPNGINPATVVDVQITQAANVHGIYAATITLENSDGANPSKFSTMFPDSCNQGEITRSILHAFESQQACPDGAPHWARCGMNRPEAGGEAGYCVGDQGDATFFIAFATLSRGTNAGNINTAFPLY